MLYTAPVNEKVKPEKILIDQSTGSIGNTQSLQKSNPGDKRERTCGLFQLTYNENHRAAITLPE